MNFKNFLIESNLLLERQLIYSDNTQEFFDNLGDTYPDVKKWINKTLRNWIMNVYLSKEDIRTQMANIYSEINDDIEKLSNTKIEKKFKNVFKNLYKNNELINKYKEKNTWLEKQNWETSTETTEPSKIAKPLDDKNIYEFDIDKDEELKEFIKYIIIKANKYAKKNPNKQLPAVNQLITYKNEKDPYKEKIKNAVIGTKILPIDALKGTGYKCREISFTPVEDEDKLSEKEREKYEKEKEKVSLACKHEADTMQNCINSLHKKTILNGTERIFSLRDKQEDSHCAIAITGISNNPTLNNPTITEIKGKNNKEVNKEYVPYVLDILSYLKSNDAFNDVNSHQWNYLGKEPFIYITKEKKYIQQTPETIKKYTSALKEVKNFNDYILYTIDTENEENATSTLHYVQEHLNNFLSNIDEKDLTSKKYYILKDISYKNKYLASFCIEDKKLTYFQYRNNMKADDDTNDESVLLCFNYFIQNDLMDHNIEFSDNVQRIFPKYNISFDEKENEFVLDSPKYKTVFFKKYFKDVQKYNMGNSLVLVCRNNIKNTSEEDKQSLLNIVKHFHPFYQNKALKRISSSGENIKISDDSLFELITKNDGVFCFTNKNEAHFMAYIELINTTLNSTIYNDNDYFEDYLISSIVIELNEKGIITKSNLNDDTLERLNLIIQDDKFMKIPLFDIESMLKLYYENVTKKEENGYNYIYCDTNKKICKSDSKLLEKFNRMYLSNIMTISNTNDNITFNQKNLIVCKTKEMTMFIVGYTNDKIVNLLKYNYKDNKTIQTVANLLYDLQTNETIKSYQIQEDNKSNFTKLLRWIYLFEYKDTYIPIFNTKLCKKFREAKEELVKKIDNEYSLYQTDEIFYPLYNTTEIAKHADNTSIKYPEDYNKFYENKNKYFIIRKKKKYIALVKDNNLNNITFYTKDNDERNKIKEIINTYCK